MAAATVSGSVVYFRRLFRYAVESGYIYLNPFDKIVAGSQANVKRQYYVDGEKIARMMKVARNDTERLLVLLGRYAGLRIPSEIWQMKFEDLKSGMIRIPENTKTGSRELPMFHEIREVFERMSGEPDEYVFRAYLKSPGNARTVVTRVVRDSGLERWPKLMINLRSSLITDLSGRGYGEKTLDAFFGNSANVRSKHYVQFRKDVEYDRMIRDNETIVKFLSENGGTFENDDRINSLQNLLNLVKNLVSRFQAENGESRQGE